MDKIEEFRGKRNTALTIMLPPGINIRKQLDPIDRKVKAMKHKNKSGQIHAVIKKIFAENEDKITSGNGLIVCAGLGNDKDIFYQEIEPKKKIKEFFYDYFDTFDLDRIREYLYDMVERCTDFDNLVYCKQINASISSGSRKCVLGNEIEKAIEMKVLSTLFWFSSDRIDKNLLQKAEKLGFKIIIMDMEKQVCKDLVQKYGSKLGFLYYEISL